MAAEPTPLTVDHIMQDAVKGAISSQAKYKQDEADKQAYSRDILKAYATIRGDRPWKRADGIYELTGYVPDNVDFTKDPSKRYRDSAQMGYAPGENWWEAEFGAGARLVDETTVIAPDGTKHQITFGLLGPSDTSKGEWQAINALASADIDWSRVDDNTLANLTGWRGGSGAEWAQIRTDPKKFFADRYQGHTDYENSGTSGFADALRTVYSVGSTFVNPAFGAITNATAAAQKGGNPLTAALLAYAGGSGIEAAGLNIGGAGMTGMAAGNTAGAGLETAGAAGGTGITSSGGFTASGGTGFTGGSASSLGSGGITGAAGSAGLPTTAGGFAGTGGVTLGAGAGGAGGATLGAGGVTGATLGAGGVTGATIGTVGAPAVSGLTAAWNSLGPAGQRLARSAAVNLVKNKGQLDPEGLIKGYAMDLAGGAVNEALGGSEAWNQLSPAQKAIAIQASQQVLTTGTINPAALATNYAVGEAGKLVDTALGGIEFPSAIKDAAGAVKDATGGIVDLGKEATKLVGGTAKGVVRGAITDALGGGGSSGGVGAGGGKGSSAMLGALALASALKGKPEEDEGFDAFNLAQEMAQAQMEAGMQGEYYGRTT